MAATWKYAPLAAGPMVDADPDVRSRTAAIVETSLADLPARRIHLYATNALSATGTPTRDVRIGFVPRRRSNLDALPEFFDAASPLDEKLWSSRVTVAAVDLHRWTDDRMPWAAWLAQNGAKHISIVATPERRTSLLDITALAVFDIGGLDLDDVADRFDVYTDATLTTIPFDGPRTLRQLHDRAPSRRSGVAEIARCGINALTEVGADTGVVIGVTELDRQPVRIDLEPWMTRVAPVTQITGGGGAGKSVLASSIAYQSAMLHGHRTVYVGDDSHGSEARAFHERLGATIVTTAELLEVDGIADPFRWAPPDLVAAYVCPILEQAGLIGISDETEAKWRAVICAAAGRGVTSTIEVIETAVANRELPRRTMERVDAALAKSPVLRLVIGRSATAAPIPLADTLTRIEFSREDAWAGFPLRGTIARTFVAAVQHAAGDRAVIVADLELAYPGGSDITDLARSAHRHAQKVIVVDRDVRVDAHGDLICLPVHGHNDAEKVCAALRIEPTPARLARIATCGRGWRNWGGAAFVIGFGDDERRVHRGPIAWVRDADGRTAEVEIVLPDEFA